MGELENLGYTLHELDKPEFENKNRKTEVKIKGFYSFFLFFF